MKRDDEEALLDFCVSQHGAFDRDAWLNSQAHPRSLIRAVALLLAGGEWYGHTQELADVARQASVGERATLSALAQKHNLDCSRFNNMLRHLLRHALTAA